MKEIKFRAWIDDPDLCNEDEIANHLDESGEFIPFMQDLEYWYFDDGQTLGDYFSTFGKDNIMQYTGIKDKNGKEVYEGDVLTGGEYPFKDEGDFNYNGEVFWSENEAMFGIELHCVNPNVAGVLSGICEVLTEIEFEVIGNIYENPEVLEVE